jgi:hypothetical protein
VAPEQTFDLWRDELGPIYWACAQRFEWTMEQVDRQPPWVIRAQLGMDRPKDDEEVPSAVDDHARATRERLAAEQAAFEAGERDAPPDVPPSGQELALLASQFPGVVIGGAGPSSVPDARD